VFDLTVTDGQVHCLTNDGTSEYPSWSPDGSRIAFDDGAGFNHQLYVMNADGSGVTRLTNDSADDSNAVWTR
jgi:TolB protein